MWADLKQKEEIDLTPNEFKDKFLIHLNANYDYAWTLTLNKPMGIIFGQIAGPMMLLGDMHWFGWTTKRNKIECAVKFINEIRKTNLSIMYSTLEDKKFYEHIAKHGILRRVGTIYGIYEDEGAATFQTRT